ncbi:sugar transferase [Daejeonella sp.]|jgi:lipopolysaccharide/colanic/teichoic acid biosynthesis glycosyltransferase|uniref:sugar transferase n=1 Tax=Daejeonella sp. TaxID=2805397 RepID=UPI00378418BC
MVAKRIFDVFFSVLGIIFIFPLLVIIAVIILLDSKGWFIYKQVRVGLNSTQFNLFKFRTMKIGADKGSLLTIGNQDERITRFGNFLRKYKLDELPQLFNILIGDMSFVGPRPEVSKYVALYNQVQLRILTVKPGLTDWASIDYIDEAQLLARAKNPEAFYVEYIIPQKIAQNLRYIEHNNLWIDLKIILLTIKSILSKLFSKPQS